MAFHEHCSFQLPLYLWVAEFDKNTIKVKPSQSHGTNIHIKGFL
jgi:hypothetical protein